MLENIIALLKESGVHAWEVTELKQRGWEFYFIRHALDQHRAKDVEYIQIKVYQLLEDGAFMGSASAGLPPTASEAEAKKLIQDLAYRATLVKNKPYPLNPPRPGVPMEAPVDLAAIAEDFIRTMAALPETDTEDVNSYEIFVNEKVLRFVNSEGVDVTERFPDSMIEVVVNARKDGHEIELYRNFCSGTCDGAGLREKLSKAMAYGRDRLRTRPTPNLEKADVLFSGADACSIYEFFSDRCDPAMIFRRMSDWEPGKPVAQELLGDKLSVFARRELPNSSKNRGFDGEGAPIRDVSIIQDGVVRELLGGRMFSSYMGLENSFDPTNIEVTGGTASEEELRKGPYLEAVEFSDFQVDTLTGDIFGEIRLAYWHDGETVTPVSGGSVSGSMFDFVKTMRMSREQTQYDNMRIPALTLLKNVTVTGAEG